MAEALPEHTDSDFSEEEQTPEDVMFNQAANHVKSITSKLDNNQLLQIYGLFKQATEGPCVTPRPGILDARGRKKWYAWKTLGDMPKVEAKKKYTILVQNFDPDWKAEDLKKPKENWMRVSSHHYIPEPALNSNEASLLDAAREDFADRVTELLSLNPTLKSAADQDGLTALHWAADRDATRALLAVINAGCPVDTRDGSGQTALHYAAACGHVESVKILLKHGASPLCEDEEGSTPIDSAVDDEMKSLLETALE